MIGFIVWSIVAVSFTGIGISGWKSEKAVGFFTFLEPPKVNDVKKYNHAVSTLWIVSAILLEVLGIPLLVLEQNSPVFIPVIGMIIAYIRIEHRHKT